MSDESTGATRRVAERSFTDEEIKKLWEMVEATKDTLERKEEVEDASKGKDRGSTTGAGPA